MFLFAISIISHFRFNDTIFVLFVPVPGHCFLLYSREQTPLIELAYKMAGSSVDVFVRRAKKIVTDTIC